MPNSILIADDEESVRKIVRRLLERAGYVCFEACDGLDAVQKATELQPDLVVLDVRMPRMNGIEVASVLKDRAPQTKIILMTVYNVGPRISSVVGAKAVLIKPDGITKLVECVQEVLRAGAPQGTSRAAKPH